MDTFGNRRQEFEAFLPIQEIKRMEEKKICLDLDGDTTNTKEFVNYLLCKAESF